MEVICPKGMKAYFEMDIKNERKKNVDQKKYEDKRHF